MDNVELDASEKDFIEQLENISRKEKDGFEQLRLFKNGDSRTSIVSSEPEIAKPDLSIGERQQNMLEQINNQRLEQRKILLWFIIILTSSIAAIFAAMLFVNCIFGVLGRPQVFSDIVLNITGVSFFVELIAVIKIVTEKLWDERQFLDSEAFKSIPKDKAEKS